MATRDYLEAPASPAELGPELAESPVYGPAPAPLGLGGPVVEPLVNRLQPATGWGCGAYADGTAVDDGLAPVEAGAALMGVRQAEYPHSSRLVSTLPQAVADPAMPGAAPNYLDLAVRSYADE
jgi:hypothetical protein